jgi:hypothetical protein
MLSVLHPSILLGRSRDYEVKGETNLEPGQKGIYGKINFCMKTQRIILQGNPPRMVPIILAGFNTVASHVYLIILPVLVDLLLWFGPKLHMKSLLLPIFTDFSNNLLKISPAEMVDTVKSSQALWEQLLNQLNLGNAIRTFPVGVPSIIARISPVATPLNNGWVIEIPTFNLVFAALALLLLVGFLLGTVYFYLISRVTNKEVEPFSFKDLLNNYLQSILMFCMFLAIALVISIPGFIVLSIFSLISPSLAQFVLLFAAFIALWLVIPLVFSPHGVFVLKQKALASMLISVRLVRFFLPGTGLFFMTTVLISEGMNLLWTMPDTNSWMALIGVGGHAFIITGLLTASFIYYREGLRWMQENLKRIAEAAKTVESGGTPIEQ